MNRRRKSDTLIVVIIQTSSSSKSWSPKNPVFWRSLIFFTRTPNGGGQVTSKMSSFSSEDTRHPKQPSDEEGKKHAGIEPDTRGGLHSGKVHFWPRARLISVFYAFRNALYLPYECLIDALIMLWKFYGIVSKFACMGIIGNVEIHAQWMLIRQGRLTVERIGAWISTLISFDAYDRNNDTN